MSVFPYSDFYMGMLERWYDNPDVIEVQPAWSYDGHQWHRPEETDRIHRSDPSLEQGLELLRQYGPRFVWRTSFCSISARVARLTAANST